MSDLIKSVSHPGSESKKGLHVVELYGESDSNVAALK